LPSSIFAISVTTTSPKINQASTFTQKSRKSDNLLVEYLERVDKLLDAVLTAQDQITAKRAMDDLEKLINAKAFPSEALVSAIQAVRRVIGAKPNLISISTLVNIQSILTRENARSLEIEVAVKAIRDLAEVKPALIQPETVNVIKRVLNIEDDNTKDNISYAAEALKVIAHNRPERIDASVLSALEKLPAKKELGYYQYLSSLADAIAEIAIRKDELALRSLSILERILNYSSDANFTTYFSEDITKAVTRIALESRNDALAKKVSGILEGLSRKPGLSYVVYQDTSLAFKNIAEAKSSIISPSVVSALGELLKQGALNLRKGDNEALIYFNSVVRALETIAKTRSDLSERCILLLEGLLITGDLQDPRGQNFPETHKAAFTAIKNIDKAKPELIKTNSLSGLLLSFTEKDSYILRHGLPHFQVYFNTHFQEVTKAMPAEIKYSIGLSVYRLLSRYNIAINDQNEQLINRAIDFIIKKRVEVSTREIFSPNTKVINILHSEKTFDAKYVSEVEKYAGVTLIDSYKGMSQKNDSLQKIIDTKGPLTVFFYGHGGPQHLWLDSGQAGSEYSDTLRDDRAISYQELGDALIKRGNLQEVVILIDACYSYNFSANLLNHLFKQNSTVFPLIVSVGNLDRFGYGGIFLNSLNNVLNPEKPTTVQDVYNAEILAFEYQVLRLFMQINPEELKELFGTLTPAPAVFRQSDKAPGSSLPFTEPPSVIELSGPSLPQKDSLPGLPKGTLEIGENKTNPYNEITVADSQKTERHASSSVVKVTESAGSTVEKKESASSAAQEKKAVVLNLDLSSQQLEALAKIESIYKKILFDKFGDFPFSSSENGNFAPADTRMIAAVFQNIGLVPGKKVVDLGAGDMRVAVIASILFGAKAIGIEKDPNIASIAEEAIKRFVGLQMLKPGQVTLIKGDILHYPKENADADVLFYYEGSGPKTEEVGDMILREITNPDAKIILNAYIPEKGGFKRLNEVVEYIGRKDEKIKIYTLPRRESASSAAEKQTTVPEVEPALNATSNKMSTSEPNFKELPSEWNWVREKLIRDIQSEDFSSFYGLDSQNNFYRVYHGTIREKLYLISKEDMKAFSEVDDKEPRIFVTVSPTMALSHVINNGPHDTLRKKRVISETYINPEPVLLIIKVPKNWLSSHPDSKRKIQLADWIKKTNGITEEKDSRLSAFLRALEGNVKLLKNGREVSDFGFEFPTDIIPSEFIFVLDPLTKQEMPLQEYIKNNSSINTSSSVFDKGGIDLRALPIVTQPMPAMPGVNLSAPPLSQHNINLDTEWQEIQNILNAGIIPSCERIKEYLEASCKSQDCSQRIDNALSCLADILRLEEDRVASTEPVLKELLVLLESDKPANEMQLALSKIAVSPKEPRIVVP
jgi:hypothetical protein